MKKGEAFLPIWLKTDGKAKDCSSFRTQVERKKKKSTVDLRGEPPSINVVGKKSLQDGRGGGSLQAEEKEKEEVFPSA